MLATIVPKNLVGRMPQFFFAVMVLISISYGPVNAKNDSRISSLCDLAAHTAAREFEIPVDVLLAITRTETGRVGLKGLRPWPWTVNMEGTGYWFSNRTDALKFTIDRQQNGATSFDVGCFQINYKWHGKFFNSVDDMFEPILNARYAAHFLEQLFLEFGSWSNAAGAFHSRTPSRAESYTVRFDTIRLNVNTPTKTSRIIALPPGIFDARKRLKMRTTSLSPLVSGGLPKLGSLVPDSSSSANRRRVIDMPKQGG